MSAMPPLKSAAVFPRMVELRRTFHRYPELALEETRTAATIMEELDRLDIPYVYTGKGGCVVGRLESGKGAPTVAVRADMDALPGDEATGLPFASAVPGKMHACGHDAHMAMVLGAASLLAADPPAGNVLFVFQPAEERGGGARVVLASGLLAGARAIFGGHVTHHYRTGEIMVEPGVVTAQSDSFSIRVQGRGGHGARPHEGTDAVVVSGLLVTAFQTLVSREVNPVYPTVITVGKLQAGTAGNVMADSAVLEGTIRTTLPDVREHVHAGIRRMARAIGDAHNSSIDVTIREGYPPVVNSPRETAIARRAALNVVDEDSVVPQDYPSLGAEDFAYYLRELPGCYVRFGARIRDREYIPLHSPAFDIDEDVLQVGAAFFDQVVREAIADYGG